jgi:rRNA processing protein Gar1
VCGDSVIIKTTCESVPKFNRRVFLANKEEIGNVDEIFGRVTGFVRTLFFFFIMAF